MVNDVGVVIEDGKATFDGVAAGMKVSKKYKAPMVKEAAVFSKEVVQGLAHTIGRNVFGLGDLVYSYTTLGNINVPRSEWWN